MKNLFVLAIALIVCLVPNACSDDFTSEDLQNEQTELNQRKFDYSLYEQWKNEDFSRFQIAKTKEGIGKDDYMQLMGEINNYYETNINFEPIFDELIKFNNGKIEELRFAGILSEYRFTKLTKFEKDVNSYGLNKAINILEDYLNENMETQEEFQFWNYYVNSILILENFDGNILADSYRDACKSAKLQLAAATAAAIGACAGSGWYSPECLGATLAAVGLAAAVEVECSE